MAFIFQELAVIILTLEHRFSLSFPYVRSAQLHRRMQKFSLVFFTFQYLGGKVLNCLAF